MPNNVNDVRLRVTPLQYIDVAIDNVKCNGLCDSGAQIPMINKRLVEGNAESLGTLQVQGVVGDPVQAELVSLTVSCCPDADGKFIDVNGPTQIVFAVTDCMTGCDVILPSTICDELRTVKPYLVMQYLMLTVFVLTNQSMSVLLMNHKPANNEFSHMQFHTTKAMICLA